MKTSTRSMVLALGLCTWLPSTSVGSPITFDFSGVITEVAHGDPNYPFDNAQPVVGDLVTGRFSFDPEQLADNNPNPAEGRYWFAPEHGYADLWLGLSYSGHSYGYGIGLSFSDNWSMQVIDNEPGHGADMIQLYMESGASADHRFWLTDSKGTALNSDALPTTINLADWTAGGASRHYLGYDPRLVTVEITGFPVPEESSTAGLLVFDLLAIAGLCRRKS